MGMHCTHKGIQKVLTIGKCEIHAGSESDVFKGGHAFDLVISLTGRPGRAPAKSLKFRMSKGANRMLSNVVSYAKSQKKDHSLIIDWPDMGLPPVAPSFWEALYLDLFEFSGKVVIHCMGGHGRTGTALAILAHLNHEPVPDIVKFIRETYCEESVETSGQMDYLKNVIGISTECTGGKSFQNWNTVKPSDYIVSGIDDLFPDKTKKSWQRRDDDEFPAWFKGLGGQEE